MNHDQAYAEILQFFMTNYNLIPVNPALGLDPLPDLVLDNNPESLPDTKLSWLRVTLRPGSGVQQTLGNVGSRKFERIGTLWIQIFTPLNMGMKASNYLADGLGFLEGGKTPQGITFTAVSPPSNIGNDGAWNQANVSADYSYYETK